MTLDTRNVRALAALVVLLLIAAYVFWPSGAVLPASTSADVVQTTEKHLEVVRNIAASASAKEDVLAKVKAELASRESGLIRADSPQQAQAQTITILRDLLSTEGVDIASTELGPLQPLGNDYGLAPVSVQFESHVEQLVNVLAGIGARPELVSIRGFQIMAANPQRKTVRVRLTAAGVIPKSLLPAKDQKTKGGGGL